MIYHLKALTPEDHEVWTKHLKKHRASGLETEVESFEEWRHKRQSRHVSAIAKEKAKVDVSRGLQGSQQVKEKLQSLDQWIKEQKNQYGDKQPDWMGRLVQLTEDLEVAIDRQDQQWHVIQETVIQADPFGLNRTSGTSTPLSTIADTNKDIVDDSSPINGMACLRRTGTLLSHNSSFSEEFYDAEDVELSPSEEDNDGDGDVHIEETADTTDDDEEEEEEEEEEPVSEHQAEDFGSGQKQKQCSRERKVSHILLSARTPSSNQGLDPAMVGQSSASPSLTFTCSGRRGLRVVCVSKKCCQGPLYHCNACQYE
jgi:hypothetical protein